MELTVYFVFMTMTKNVVQNGRLTDITTATRAFTFAIRPGETQMDLYQRAISNMPEQVRDGAVTNYFAAPNQIR